MKQKNTKIEKIEKIENLNKKSKKIVGRKIEIEEYICSSKETE